MKMFNTVFLTALVIFFLTICFSCDGDDSDDSDDRPSDDTDVDDDDDDEEPGPGLNDDDFYEAAKLQPDIGTVINGVYYQQISGGGVGETGTSTVLGPDGTIYIAAEKGGLIYIYSKSPDAIWWTREPVAYFAISPSLGIDSEGNLHLAYQDRFEFREKTEWSYNYKLLYMTNADGSWRREVVDDDGDVGYAPSLVVDKNDNIHIAYAGSDVAAVKYASNRSGTWVCEAVAPVNYPEYFYSYGGAYSYLVIDDDGFAHISFFNAAYHAGVYYTTNKEPEWTCCFMGTGNHSSFVLDEDGAAHIFYETVLGYNSYIYLGYATDKFGFWFRHVVDWGTLPMTSTSYLYPCTFLGDDGSLRVVFSAKGTFYFGVFKNGTWTLKNMFIKGDYQSNLSLAVDTNGLIHITYYIYSHKMLEHTTFNPETWEHDTERFEECFNVNDSRENSLSIDSSGQPHVSFRDLSRDQLKFAKRTGGTWQTQTVDHNQDNVYNTSLFIDSEDVDHILYGVEVDVFDGHYYTNEFYYLRYANNGSGSWEIRDLADDYLYSGVRITMGKKNDVHAMYTMDGLRYITNKAGGWIKTLLAEGCCIGSLFMDDEGRLNMMYKGQNGVTYATYFNGVLEEKWNKPTGHCASGDSMVMDTGGFHHAIYCVYDEPSDSSALFYVTDREGQWDAYQLSDMCENPRIHADSQDHLYISNGNGYLTNQSGEWVESYFLPASVNNSGVDALGILQTIFAYRGALWYARLPGGYENK